MKLNKANGYIYNISAGRNIWKNFQFTRFFTSFVVSNLGDWFDIFALQIIFAYEWNASPFLLGILLLLYFLPSIILSPIAGILADRVSKRNLMMYTDILAAVFTVGLYFSSNTTEALIVLFIRSCVVTFNIPAQQAYIKYIVNDEHLLKASSYTTIAFQICKILGPMLGSLLLIFMSARTCLVINVFSFIISALILLGLPKKEINTKTDAKNDHWVKDMKRGAMYIWKTGVLRISVIIVMIWFCCSLIRQSQLAIFLKHLLSFQPHTLGIYMSLDGFGAVTASSILSHKKNLKNYGIYYFLGFFLLGFGIFGLAIYNIHWSIYLLYVTAIVTGLGTGVLLVNYSFFIKNATPTNLIGCVYGITIALQNAAQTIGSFSSGFLVLWFGTKEVYLGIAIMMLILGIYSAFFYIRNRNTSPSISIQNTKQQPNY